MKLRLSKIKADRAIQIRRKTNKKTVQRYQESFDKLPPIDVFETEGGMILADGFHRMAAAKRLGLSHIEVIIHQGNRDDALKFAVLANTKNGEPLTAEERDDGVRRLKKLNPKRSIRQIAELMSISRSVVHHVFQIDEVRKKTRASVPAGTLSDTHYREIAAAPNEHWQPLLEATEKRKWTSRVTALAVQNLKDERTPEKLKRDIIAGTADPISITADGKFSIPIDVIAQKMKETSDNDAVLAVEYYLKGSARMHLFKPQDVIDLVGQPRLNRLLKELPGDMHFLQQLIDLGQREKVPKIVA